MTNPFYSVVSADETAALVIQTIFGSVAESIDRIIVDSVEETKVSNWKLLLTVQEKRKCRTGNYC
jgi:hypothetical protein